MKKIKSIMTLGVFLMAFFVIGLQSANAQFQNTTDAYTTIKVEYKSMTAKSVAAPATAQALASTANAEVRVTKVFMSLLLTELNDSEATTATAITSVYNALVEQSNGHANRIALLDSSKLYIENLLQ